MFLDLTQDRSKNRFVNAIVFILAFAVVANLVLVAVLRDPRFREGLPEPEEINYFTPPATRGNIGKTMSPAPAFRVKNFEGFGLPDVEVEAELLDVTVNLRGSPFANITCADRVNSLVWQRERVFCDAEIMNGVNTTVDGGLVTFDDMYLVSGPPGRYRFRFTGEDLYREFEVTMTSDVAAVVLETDPVSTMTVNEPLGDIRVKVVDYSGEPLAGRQVNIFPYALTTIDTSTQWLPDVDANKHALLENNIAETDENGIATFSGLTVTGFTNDFEYLEIMCDGAYTHLYESFEQPIFVQSDVASVEITTGMSTFVVEGEELSTKPSITVKDASGNPVAGRRGFAIMTIRAGKTVPPFFTAGTTVSDKTDKVIINPIASALSDENGVITFDDLRFSIPGEPGTYKMKYVVDGVESLQSAAITVASSVAQVQLDWFPPEKRNVFTYFESLPTVTAFNADGEGVRGKTVDVDVVLSATGESSDSINLITVPEITSTEGTSTMKSMYLKAGVLDQYRFIFSVDGVQSRASASMWLGLATASRRRELQQRRLDRLYGSDAHKRQYYDEYGYPIGPPGGGGDPYYPPSDPYYPPTDPPPSPGGGGDPYYPPSDPYYPPTTPGGGGDPYYPPSDPYYPPTTPGGGGDPYYPPTTPGGGGDPYYPPTTPGGGGDPYYPPTTPGGGGDPYYPPTTPGGGGDPYYPGGGDPDYPPTSPGGGDPYYPGGGDPYYPGGGDPNYPPTTPGYPGGDPNYPPTTPGGDDDPYYPGGGDPNYPPTTPGGGDDPGYPGYPGFPGDFEYYLGDEAVCGNWIVEDGECCDNSPGCTPDCQCGDDGGGFGNDYGDFPDGYGYFYVEGECGDGVVQRGAGEQCEPPGEGACSFFCTIEVTLSVCGNERIEPPFETCDDGNFVNGDGCSEYCTDETIRAVVAKCGDGKVEGDEECDTGPDSADGTNEDCYYCYEVLDTDVETVCGNGEVESPVEQCDDGNTVSGDGCDQFCLTEDTQGCGDGVIQISAPYYEECDDGNLRNGDGCSEFCYTEEISGQGLRATDKVVVEEDVPAPEGLLSADDLDNYDPNAEAPTFDDALDLTDEEIAEILGQCNTITVVKAPKQVTVRTAMQPPLRVRVKDTEGKPWAFKALTVSVDETAGAPAELVGTVTAVTDATGVASFAGLLVDGGYSASITVLFSDSDGECVGGRTSIEFRNPVANVALTADVGGRRIRAFSSVDGASARAVGGRRRQNVVEIGEVRELERFAITATITDKDSGPVLNMPAEVFVVSGPRYLVDQGFLENFSSTILDHTASDDVSDNTGTVTWTDLFFNAGTPGEFLIGTRIGGVLGPSFAMTVTSEVASIQIRTDVGLANADRVNLGSPFAVQPVIRVLDSAGNGLAGYRVFVTAGVDQNTAWAANIHSSSTVVTDEDGPSFLQLSLPSDANGDAAFRYLGMVGAARNLAGYKLVFSFGGAELDISVESSVVLPVIERLTIEVVEVGSSAVSLEAPMTIPPQVRVLNADGEYVDQFFAYAEVVVGDDAVALQNPIALWNTIATSVDGVATFDDLLVARGTIGDFDLSFFVPGGEGSDLVTKTLTDQVHALTILRQPPVTATVGEAFQVRVQVTISSGSPLVGKTVEMELLQQAGNGELDTDRVRNATDSSGVATFNAILAKGRPGTYSLRFTSDGVRSPQSRTIEVSNEVASVEIVLQPAGLKESNGKKKALVSSDVDESIESLVQPQLLVQDANGYGLSGRRVDVGFKSDGNAAVKYTTTVETDKYGQYEFTDLYFAKGSRGTYQMVFSVDGIESEPSNEIVVENELEPDTDQLNNWELLVFLTVLALVPLWFGTSLWVAEAWVLMSLVVSIGFLVLFFVTYLDGLRNRVDIFSFLLRLSLVAVLAVVFGTFLYITIQWTRRRRDSYYENHRESSYTKLVYRLLMSERRTAVFAAHDKVTGKAWQKYSDEYNKHVAFLRRPAPGPGMMNALREKWFLLRNGDSVSPPDRHMLYETENDFFFSQRFIFAATMSIFAVILTALAACILVFVVGYGIDKAGEEYWEAKAELENAGFDTNTLPALATDMSELATTAEENLNALLDDLEQLDINDLDTAEPVKDLIIELQNMAQRFDSAANLRDQFASVEETSTEYLDQVQNGFSRIDVAMTPDKLSEFREAVVITGFTATGVSFVIVMAIWVMMFRHYRAIIFGLRSGRTHQFDKSKFNFLAATNYLGIQTSHSIFEFLLIFLFVWFLFAVIGYVHTRDYVIDEAGPIILLLFSTSLLIKIVSTLVYERVLTNDNWVIKRRFLFGVADVFQSFLSIVSGLTSAIVRLGLVIGAFLALFMRLDYPLLPHPWEDMDPGFQSYFSAAIIDFYFNNPIVLLAKKIFLKEPLTTHAGVPHEDKAINVQLQLPSAASPLAHAAGLDMRFRPGTSGAPDRAPAMTSIAVKEIAYAGPTKTHDDGGADIERASGNSARRSLVARNRWALGYTLVHNRGLRAFRRRRPHRDGLAEYRQHWDMKKALRCVQREDNSDDEAFDSDNDSAVPMEQKHAHRVARAEASADALASFAWSTSDGTSSSSGRRGSFNSGSSSSANSSESSSYSASYSSS